VFDQFKIRSEDDRKSRRSFVQKDKHSNKISGLLKSNLNDVILNKKTKDLPKIRQFEIELKFCIEMHIVERTSIKSFVQMNAPIKVQNIHFAFDNREMLKLLEERGTYLKNGEFVKAEKIEEKI
jgi:hypothetical protein